MQKSSVLLFGGFSGWLNWGDILQLKSWLIFYRQRGFKITVLLEKECLSNTFHQEILKRIIKENFIFYDKGKFYDSQLRLLDRVEIDFFHVYGGGFLNPYWGKNKIEIIERTINFFKTKKYFITGQQISEEFLPYLKNHLDIYKPDILAVRDRHSLELCRDCEIDVFFSFDDSTEYLSLIKKSIDDELILVKDNKKTLFLHLNLSYYVLKEESEIWSYREKIKDIISRAENLYLVKTYHSYNTEVKDTLRAVDYIYLTMEKPKGKYLDLVTVLINEDFTFLKKSINNIYNSLAISNSYHTAFFFAFLGIPSYLLKINPYYEQKGKEIFEDIDLEGVWSNLEEIKAKQQIKLKELLEKRKKFIKEFDKQLVSSDAYNERVYDKYTYFDIPEIMIERTEIDSYIKRIIGDLNWFRVELEKTQYHLDRLTNKIKVLEADLDATRYERDNLKTTLERIYSSRGWRFLTIYYNIKRKLFELLRLIEDGNR